MNKQEYYMYKRAFVAPRPGQPGYEEPPQFKFDFGELLPALGTIAGTFSNSYKNKTGKSNVFTHIGDALGAAGNVARTLKNPSTSIGEHIGSSIGRAVGGNSPYSSILGGFIGTLPGLFGQIYKHTQDYAKNPYNHIMY